MKHKTSLFFLAVVGSLLVQNSHAANAHSYHGTNCKPSSHTAPYEYVIEGIRNKEPVGSRRNLGVFCPIVHDNIGGNQFLGALRIKLHVTYSGNKNSAVTRCEFNTIRPNSSRLDIWTNTVLKIRSGWLNWDFRNSTPLGSPGDSATATYHIFCWLPPQVTINSVWFEEI